MKNFAFLLILSLLAFLIVACTGGESSTPVAVEGPALIMFYTDN
mgnify:CR=1 FL=1